MAQNCWANVCFFSLINYPRISYLQLLAWILSAHPFMSLQCRVGKQPWSNITVQSSQKNSGKWIRHSRSCMKQQPYILLRWTLFDTVMEASQQISCHLPPWHTSQHSRCPSARESWEQGRSDRHKIDTWLTWLSCHGRCHVHPLAPLALPWLPLQADHRFAAGAVQTYLWRVPASLGRYWQAPVTWKSNGQGHPRSGESTWIDHHCDCESNIYIYIST